MGASLSDPGRLAPADLRVRLAAGALVHASGQVLAGGSPFRIVKLTGRGQGTLASWRNGAQVGDEPVVRRLARRLLDAGLLYPDPVPSASLDNLSVIVPVRDAAEALRRCLASLREEGGPALEVIVVDDRSNDPGAITDVAASHGVRLLRHAEPRNAAAARNTGIAVATRPLLAFVDADVVMTPGALHRLVAQFSDDTVMSAAPRVCGLSDQGVIGRYEARHSSLDMGPHPATVAPNTAVPYVPGATLLVRRGALDDIGGFDESLGIGEDVDLIWRLVAAGHRVIYDPSARVMHDHRRQLGPFLRRRWEYAESIGLLSGRHPQVLYAFRTDPVLALALCFAAAGRLRPAALFALVRAMLLTCALAGTDASAPWLISRITPRMAIGTVRGAGHAVRRSWSPYLLFSRRGRRLLLAASVIRVLEKGGPRTATDIGLGVIEDSVAALATTASCVRHRTARPLLVGVSPVQTLWAKPPAGHRHSVTPTPAPGAGSTENPLASSS